ncbi:hypothetical protein C6502_20435 [Candidatus Poribacteria bacterium]|nr:MAG: hypothetical protein C6502_20435 [Candidatus Poribacteria bacterium]
MGRKYNFLAIVVALVLTPVMVDAAPPAQIAFTSERDGHQQIYVMDADGKNQRRLSNDIFLNWEPSWSPDGERIAFTSTEAKDTERKRPQIYVMDADGKNRRRLSSRFIKDAEWEPSWSLDGKRIAYTSSGAMDIAGGHWRIYVIDTDGKNRQRLSNDAVDDWHPSWSPDGKRIAFVSSRDGKGHGIYVMDADGSNQRRLTDNPSREWNPSWSPDGERIAFVANMERNWDIYVMDADGKNRRRLTRNPAPDIDPSWSPDGKRIAFVSTRDGNFEIYVMNADGARLVRRRTKDHSDDIEPTWFDPAFAIEIAPFSVSPVHKKFTMWGWLKQVDR